MSPVDLDDDDIEILDDEPEVEIKADNDPWFDKEGDSEDLDVDYSEAGRSEVERLLSGGVSYSVGQICDELSMSEVRVLAILSDLRKDAGFDLCRDYNEVEDDWFYHKR